MSHKTDLQGIINSLDANKTKMDNLKQAIIELPDNRDAYIEELEALIAQLTAQIDAANAKADDILDHANNGEAVETPEG